jgi:hypothetical protein
MFGSQSHRLPPRCLRRWAWLVLLASLELGVRAEGPDRWRAHPTVGVLEGVTLRIHWFDTTAELREAAKSDGRDLKQLGLHAFSVLKRNTETGAYVCDLYVMKMSGAQVDGDRTTTFGHEVLHCLGLQHTDTRVRL